jgi:crotonobetainyl-CoA:carnitine CoA-transferase CaiB-like acyl-CoA transferase
VLDLTTVRVGPWCTRILSDFGADVIKVETPEGVSSRYTGAPKHCGMSGTFRHNGRGRRSIALDLKQPEAQDTIRRLVPSITAFAADIDSLYEMIGEEPKHRATAEWLELLEKNDIPCMRPHTLETLMQDPHLADAEFFRWVDHPSEGRIRTMREPSTWSETKPPTGRFAPRLGQHTREILAEAGFDPQVIDDLVERKVAKTD